MIVNNKPTIQLFELRPSKLKRKKQVANKILKVNKYLDSFTGYKFYNNKKFRKKNFETAMKFVNAYVHLTKLSDEQNNVIRNKKKVTIDGILNIRASLNNVIFTYSTLLGETRYSTSCGRTPGVKKGERSNYFVILDTITNFSLFLYKQNIKHIYINLNGNGLIRKTLLQGLKKSKLKIHTIFNTTPVPHNGCRLKKYRRV